jgi:hypothetical protein
VESSGEVGGAEIFGPDSLDLTRKREREKQDSHSDIAIDMAISRHRIITYSIVVPSSTPLAAVCVCHTCL